MCDYMKSIEKLPSKFPNCKLTSYELEYGNNLLDVKEFNDKIAIFSFKIYKNNILNINL